MKRLEDLVNDYSEQIANRVLLSALNFVPEEVLPNVPEAEIEAIALNLGELVATLAREAFELGQNNPDSIIEDSKEVELEQDSIEE